MTLTLSLLFTTVSGQVHVNEGRMRQHMVSQYGETGAFVLDQWLNMLAAAQGLPEPEQLRRVNDFFNARVDWVDDIANWHAEDFWATPLETLAASRGDCEDYSIGKYMSLRLLGVPNERLRMIYVNARLATGSQAHMVLGYYQTPSAQPLILDNINPNIVPASRRTDLTPVFSFNSSGLWVGGGQSSVADPTSRLSRWRNVLARMQQEGFEL